MRFWLDLFVKKGEESPWFALRCSPPSLRALAAPQRPGLNRLVRPSRNGQKAPYASQSIFEELYRNHTI